MRQHSDFTFLHGKGDSKDGGREAGEHSEPWPSPGRKFLGNYELAK